MPAVPTEAVWLLSDFIETADAGEADLIVALLNDLQLQSAKVRGMIANIDKKHWIITRDNIEEYLIDTAIIYARASAAFDFFRQKADSLPAATSWDQVKSAARQLHLHQSSYPDLYDRIDRMAQRSAGPKR